MAAPMESPVPRHDIPIAGRSGFVLVDGRQVHYLEWGHTGAPPIVCLHGGGQTAYMWESLGAALSATHHVLAPDLPMHVSVAAYRYCQRSPLRTHPKHLLHSKRAS